VRWEGSGKVTEDARSIETEGKASPARCKGPASQGETLRAAQLPTALAL